MKNDWLSDSSNIAQDFDFCAFMPEPDDDSSYDGVVEESIMGYETTRSGLQTQSLQAAFDKYASSFNEFAIARSTGQPVRTHSNQYKGFAAEEFFKHTFEIDRLRVS